jgi:hypothetical protein
LTSNRLGADDSDQSAEIFLFFKGLDCMSTIEFIAPTKTASVDTAAVAPRKAEDAVIRSLETSELRIVGGGDIAVGIR